MVVLSYLRWLANRKYYFRPKICDVKFLFKKKNSLTGPGNNADHVAHHHHHHWIVTIIDAYVFQIELYLVLADEGGVSSDEEFSGGEVEVQDVQTRTEDRELKDRLLHKFGSHISKLKMEFSKKKQKGKLPKEARETLLDWWKVHYKWPYPTVCKSFDNFIYFLLDNCFVLSELCTCNIFII